MADMRRVAGPRQGNAPTRGPVEWVLANTGSVPWNDASLRLISGPPVCPPLVAVPAAEPGQVCEFSLERGEVFEEVHLCYALVDAKNLVVGEFLHVALAPPSPPTGNAEGESPPPAPSAVVLGSSMDDVGGGAIKVDQGAVFMTEFVLVNSGEGPWPEDANVSLFYNTPGFDNLPATIEIPGKVEPQQTVHVHLVIPIPYKAIGEMTAMWALHSPSHPGFGDVLPITFDVDDFPAPPLEEASPRVCFDPPPRTSVTTKATTRHYDICSPADSDTVERTSCPDPHSLDDSPLVVEVVGSAGHLPEGASDLGPISAEKLTEHFGDGVYSLGTFQRVAGQSFLVSLLLRNSGVGPWPADCALVHVGGADLGFPGLALDGAVAPGEAVKLVFPLRGTAPGEAAWAFLDGKTGLTFGPVFHLAVLS